MKRHLSLILAISIVFALPAKADKYDPKAITGAALVATGLASALFASKLMNDHKKEQSKLTKIIQNTAMPLSYQNYDERVKNNFLRLTGGYAAGLLSFSTISTGLLLLAYNYFK